MKSISRLLWFAAALLAAPIAFASGGRPMMVKCLVVLTSRTAASPDLASLSGTVDYRQDDQLVVTIPESKLAELRLAANVQYVQTVETPGAAASGSAGEPQDPIPGAYAAARVAPRVLGSNPMNLGTYSYDGAGNITAIGSFTYFYDTRQRLVQSTTDGYLETYGYDDYGNMTSRTNQTLSTDAATNRYTGWTYNEIGAVVSGDGYSFTYDATGQELSKTFSGTTEDYVYDAADERIGVRRSGWWYWSARDESGKILRQYRASDANPSTPALWLEDFVWRDGLLLGGERPPELGGARHYHLDHLGTPRLITADNSQRISRHTYRPFGEESTSATQETAAGFGREDPLKFTGHERDFAGGYGGEDDTPGHAIDYMHARYYSALQGRFLAVDVVLGEQKKPQSWNRYAYVRNNPVNATDPDGRDPFSALVGGLISVTLESARQIRSGQPADNRKLGAALAGGLASGFFGGMGGSALKNVAMGALGAAAGGTVERTINGQATTPKTVIIEAAGGAVGNAIGRSIGNAAIEGSRSSGELGKLEVKAAIQRTEAAGANAGLGADAATQRQAADLTNALRGGATTAGGIGATVVTSEGNAATSPQTRPKVRVNDDKP